MPRDSLLWGLMTILFVIPRIGHLFLQADSDILDYANHAALLWSFNSVVVKAARQCVNIRVTVFHQSFICKNRQKVRVLAHGL